MESAAKCLKGEPYTIYLVDNASTEPMPEVVKQYIRAHGVTFLQSTVNGGYARGNNIGIRQALEDGCEYLLITNNDILFGKDAVQNMAAYLKLHPDTGSGNNITVWIRIRTKDVMFIMYPAAAL